MTENRQTVLVVDDQPTWLDLMTTLLKDDFEVFQADSLNAALKAIREQKPPFHVVVTDLRLIDEPKNEEGLALIKQINCSSGETQTIVITGYPTVPTARKALRQLQAFDYLPKVPPDGDFNPMEFCRIVQQAAEKAERQRPRAFIHSDWRILVIESNKTWRKKLVEILISDGYQVKGLQDTTDLDQRLNHQKKPYNLILVNEIFIGEKDDFASIVHRYHPECRIIILTEEAIDNTLRDIQEGVALCALPIRDDIFNPWKFRETVHRVFAPISLKYAIVNFEGIDEEQPLLVGRSYTLSIRLQDNREVGAVSVSLTPPIGNHNRIQVKVFVHAPQMELRPDAEAYWDIPHQGSPSPFLVKVIPHFEQRTVITIELEQDNRWLGRIEKKVIVNVDQA